MIDVAIAVAVVILIASVAGFIALGAREPNVATAPRPRPRREPMATVTTPPDHIDGADARDCPCEYCKAEAAQHPTVEPVPTTVPETSFNVDDVLDHLLAGSDTSDSIQVTLVQASAVEDVPPPTPPEITLERYRRNVEEAEEIAERLEAELSEAKRTIESLTAEVRRQGETPT